MLCIFIQVVEKTFKNQTQVSLKKFKVIMKSEKRDGGRFHALGKNDVFIDIKIPLK